MNIILLMIEIIFKEKIKVTTTGLENIFKGNLFIFLRYEHDQQNENLGNSRQYNDNRYYANAIKDD